MKNVQFSKLVTPIACVLTLLLGVNSQLLAKDTETKIKDKIEDIAQDLKDLVGKAGDKIEDIQHSFDSYRWKGVLSGAITLGPVTLDDLKLEKHHRAMVARPGENLKCKISYKLDASQCSALDVYRVVIGYKGIGPQTTVGASLGVVDVETRERFDLVAPSQEGVYEIRARVVKGYTEDNAMRAWLDPQGNEPGSETTIGLIYVKS